MSVDLSKCVPGQKLRRRDGTTVEFVGMNCHSRIFPFLLSGGEIYMQNGRFLKSCQSSEDIVEILPLDETHGTVLTDEQMSMLAESLSFAIKHDKDMLGAHWLTTGARDRLVERIAKRESLLEILKKAVKITVEPSGTTDK